MLIHVYARGEFPRLNVTNTIGCERGLNKEEHAAIQIK